MKEILEKNKSLVIFLLAINVICLFYGCVSMMWNSSGLGILFGSILNVTTFLLFISKMLKYNKKEIIIVAIITAFMVFYSAIYLCFENAFSPLSFVAAGGIYGISAAIASLFNIDIQANMHLVIGSGFAIVSILMIMLLFIENPLKKE